MWAPRRLDLPSLSIFWGYIKDTACSEKLMMLPKMLKLKLTLNLLHKTLRVIDYYLMPPKQLMAHISKHTEMNMKLLLFLTVWY